MQELWRHALLRRLRAVGALADWQVARLQNWRHSGFTLDAGEAPIAADDAACLRRPGRQAGRRRLAEYLLRAPFSLEKITYNAESGSVLVDAASGTVYPVDPPRCQSRLPYPRPRDERLRHRAAAVEPGEDFDPTGFELPPAPEAPAEAV